MRAEELRPACSSPEGVTFSPYPSTSLSTCSWQCGCGFSRSDSGLWPLPPSSHGLLPVMIMLRLLRTWWHRRGGMQKNVTVGWQGMAVQVPR